MLIKTMMLVAMAVGQLQFNSPAITSGNLPFDPSTAFSEEVDIPELTRVQMEELQAPAPGTLLFQADQETGYYLYDGEGWMNMEAVVLLLEENPKALCSHRVVATAVAWRIASANPQFIVDNLQLIEHNSTSVSEYTWMLHETVLNPRVEQAKNLMATLVE
ncbi:hypothetical protein [Pontibacter sp. G13]|uniref:hypothetical protein n=1 Tax=Pontibacter sp. G13 TaxID=3074898 RepID=UPI00288C4986|nr:hypothetical protein [Pontibacter sp. G13]WNJ19451.1 hypothetical protein RJD25_03070 [Pontibacter sp. G13]